MNTSVEKTSEQAPEMGGAPGYYRVGAGVCFALVVVMIYLMNHASEIAHAGGLAVDQTADVGVPVVVALLLAGFSLAIGRPMAAVAVLVLIQLGSGPLSGMNGLTMEIKRIDTADTYPAVVAFRPAVDDRLDQRAGEGLEELATEFVEGVERMSSGKSTVQMRGNVPYESPVLGALKRGAEKRGASEAAGQQALPGDAPEIYKMPDWSKPN